MRCLPDHGTEVRQVSEPEEVGRAQNSQLLKNPHYTTLVDLRKGEQTAHACVMAWLRQLSGAHSVPASIGRLILVKLFI